MVFTRDWLEPSAEAKQKGVCHTEDECKQMYSEIDEDKKARAVDYLRRELRNDADKIRESIVESKETGESWVAGYHFGWGMAVRNLLRRAGMGEPYFGIDNLDCIYQFLVEEAVAGDDHATS